MKNVTTIAIAAAIVLCIAAIGQATGTVQLTVQDCRTQRVFLKIPIDYGRTFSIRYIHSVDLSPVFERFKVERGDGLILEETYFRMFGAGMGHWRGHGKLVHDGRWTRIKDIHKTVGRFILRVGSKGVDHTILLGDHAYNLTDIAAGRSVEIFVSEEEKKHGT